MSMNTDGPKKAGKFLKKGSKILKAVQLSNYSFNLIDTEANIEFDNTERTIIHARLHDAKEIERNIKDSDRLAETLHDPSQPRMSIIMPGDFTQDWFNERMSSKRRSLGFEDEDDFDYPDAANRSVSKKSDAKASMPEDSSKIDQPLQATAPINVQPTDLKSLSISPEQEGIGVDALESLARPISIVKEPYSQKIVAETELRSKLTPLQKESESEFIALETTNRDLTAKNDVQNVEDQAINTYRNRAELESQNAALLEEIKLAAKSDGYNEGFRLGEEKGVLAGQHTAGEIFKRVTELIHEFEGLKGSVLGNIQQNFYELSQAVAESLLEREFSISPSAFAKVLEKVLKDTVSDNEFKIKLHPDTWQKVTDLKIPNFEGHLVKDPSILVGEFKVESNLTVVDGNAKKIVAQMLQNVDMNLFEDSKIAG